jgi:hypothetical protein
VHQGSALSPYLFSVIIDKVIKKTLDKILWCMIVANDIILVKKNLEVNKLALGGK